MPLFVARRFASITVLALAFLFSHSAYAEDPPTGAALIEAQLEEAKRLLEEDKASFAETAEKKRAIDEKIAAREAREEEIRAELQQLCEEQDKLSPGTLDSCLAKLNN